MMFFNPKTAMAATEEAYPVLVGAYRKLTKSIGILDPAPLVVTESYIAHGPAVAALDTIRLGHVGDHIAFTRELAELGDSPVTRGIMAHETGHVLTRKSVSGLDMQFSPIKSIIRSRNIERQMDRIGAIITGAEDMLAARHWVSHEGVEMGRVSNKLSSSTILSGAHKKLKHFMEDIDYVAQFGIERSAQKNILDGAAGDRSFVERLAQEYNAAREAGFNALKR